MISCRGFCIVLSVVLAVLTYYALQPAEFTFRLQLEVVAPVSDVFSFFNEPKNLPQIHIVLRKVEVLSEKKYGELQYRKLIFHEQIPYAGELKYLVNATSDTRRRIVEFIGSPAPIISFDNWIQLERWEKKGEEETTLVTDAMSGQAPWIIHKFVKTYSYNAHMNLWSNVKFLLEKIKDPPGH